MKNIFITLTLVLVSALSLLAQDCATGYCPTKIYSYHNAGAVAPETKNIVYGVKLSYITGKFQCWITQNLGASVQATSWDDARDDAAGWFWQFNRKRGYFFNSSGTRIPGSVWLKDVSDSGKGDWLPENDPCSLLLGGGWRLPTSYEWSRADNIGSWDNPSEVFGSELKIHCAGGALNSTGDKLNRAIRGYYWSSVSGGYDTDAEMLYISSTSMAQTSEMKVIARESGCAIRCIRDF